MLTKIKNFFKQEPVDTRRQRNLDLLKALSIFCMVICHVVMGTTSNETAYFFADRLFGSYLGVAHAFVFCMGVGMVFTRKNRPVDFIKRGIVLFILAYVVNLCRGALIMGIFSSDKLQMIIEYFMMNDVLQFAAVANIVIGILKACKLKNIHIFIVGVVLSIAATFIPSVDTGNLFLNEFLGMIIPTYNTVGYYGDWPTTTSSFTFISWFVFTGAGLVFGDIIQRVKNKDKFYRIIAIVCGVIAVSYLTFINFAAHFDNPLYYLNINGAESTWAALGEAAPELAAEVGYYSVGLLDVIGLLSLDLCLAGVFYFISKKDICPFLKMTANNLTPLYVIHWAIAGTIIYAASKLGWDIPALACYGIGVAVYLVSAFLSVPVCRLIKKINSDPLKAANLRK